uniref:Mesoderm development candidate 2 n=1 Tax=Romanomermis culicivorax TaxID=13658 RepID=A0A915I300_ROMCU
MYKSLSTFDLSAAEFDYLDFSQENDAPLEPDEQPEWKRPQPKIDLSQIDTNNPESFLQMSKKGKTLMMFVSVSGNPDQKELEDLTQLWQTGLMNAHVDCQRLERFSRSLHLSEEIFETKDVLLVLQFIVDSNRAIFMFKDGSKAWEAKNFLLKQDRCREVTIEGKSYPGEKYRQEKTEL